MAFLAEKDSEGFYHHHDENHITQTWRCENDHGHTFTSSCLNHCWCGWNQGEPGKLYHVQVEGEHKEFKFAIKKPVITNDQWINNLLENANE